MPHSGIRVLVHSLRYSLKTCLNLCCPNIPVAVSLVMLFLICYLLYQGFGLCEINKLLLLLLLLLSSHLYQYLSTRYNGIL
jgi:hypothetical protein